MAVSISEYLNYIKTSTVLRPRVRMQFLRSGETVESEIITDVLGGSLNINRDNGVRRAVSIEMQNLNGMFNPDRYGVWINRKFKLFLGYNINGEDLFFPQGIFVMSNPTYTSTSSGSRVTISGSDKFSLLDGTNGGYLNNIYQIPVSSDPNAAIRALLGIYNDPAEPLLQDTAVTTPYTIRKNYDDTARSVLEELEFMLSRNVYYNEEGRLVFKDDIDDDQKGSLYDFNFGSTSFEYLGSNREADFSKVYNIVKVIGDNVNGDIAIGEARDENPLSPTNVSIIGEKPHPPIFQDVIQTDAQALALAEYVLKRSLILNNLISISSIPMFHLDVDQIITLTDENHGFNRQRFLINSISIPLEVGGTMSITAVNADEVDIRNQA